MSIDIQQLSELERKATPGPWEVDYLDKAWQRVVRAEHYEIFTGWHHSVGSIEVEMEANAALIVAMRNALPALLASLASKDAEIERQALALREMTFSRDTWRKVAEGRGSDIERETKIARAAESRLTTALAERDEALERAATKATSFLVGDPENGVPFRSPMPHEIADAIRKMKALS